MLHECGLLGEVLECVQQGREDLLDSALVGEDLLYLLVRDLAFLGRALHVDLQVLLADLLVLRCFVCLLGFLLSDVGSEVRLHHLETIDDVATGVAKSSHAFLSLATARLAAALHATESVLSGLVLQVLEEEVVEEKERRREGGTMWSRAGGY